VRCALAFVLKLETCIRTSEDSGSHADVAIPGRRMKPNVTSDKRIAEEMVTLQVFVKISSEILSTIQYALLVTVFSHQTRTCKSTYEYGH